MAPCFATPLLTKIGSNNEYIQDIDRDGILNGLIDFRLPKTTMPARNIPNRQVTFETGKPYIAFMPLSTDLIFGTPDEVAEQLTRQADKLDAFPYTQRSIGRFLRNKSIESRAKKNIHLKKEGFDFFSDLPNIQSLHEIKKIQIFHIVSAAHDHPQYARTKNINDAEIHDKIQTLKELHPNLFRVKRADIRPREFLEHLLWEQNNINRSFSYIRALGGAFNTTDRGAFYGSFSVGGSATAIAWHKARELSFMGPATKDVHQYSVSKWLVEGKFADLRSIAFDREDYSRTQVVALRLRQLGIQGAIYENPYGSGGPLVVVFDPRAILKGQYVGSITFTVNANGQFEYTDIG